MVPFVAVALFLLSLTGVAFLADAQAAIGTTITALPVPGGDSTLGSGQLIKVLSPFAAPIFTVQAGVAKLDAGQQLYRIEVNPNFSHKVVVNFMWIDSQNANAALKTGWMQVGVFYKRENTPCSVPADYVTKDKHGTDICVTPADVSTTFGTALLTQEYVNALVKSTQANQSDLYVIASVYNNGGNIPPAQQGQLGSFKYFVQAGVK